MRLAFELLHPMAKLPTFGTSGAAGMDFYAIEHGGHVAGTVTKVSLGLAVEVPPFHALLITSRSSFGVKHGAGVPHGYGLIDSDYRGELFMVFRSEKHFKWELGDRIAQGMIVAVPHVDIVRVNKVTPTERGAGGFGSTGS